MSFVEEPEKPECPANESFSKYLQPSQSIPEESNSPVSIMDSYFSEAASSSPVLSSGMYLVHQSPALISSSLVLSSGKYQVHLSSALVCNYFNGSQL